MSKTSKSNIFEIKITIQSECVGDIDLIKQIFLGMGIDRGEIVESREMSNFCLSVYYTSKQKVNKIYRRLCSFELKHITIDLNCLREKDWKSKWRDGLNPFTLTKTFGVIPTHLRLKHRFKNRTPLYIDTDLAFGTGLHATTRFMAGFVERCQSQFNSFLDVGTGTGILSMIAFKCGCRDVHAFDISKSAVEVARNNFKRNDCSSIHVYVGDGQLIQVQRKYDFVCANIVTHDLITMADKLIASVRDGKYLAVSGISLNNYKFFRKFSWRSATNNM